MESQQHCVPTKSPVSIPAPINEDFDDRSKHDDADWGEGNSHNGSRSTSVSLDKSRKDNIDPGKKQSPTTLLPETQKVDECDYATFTALDKFEQADVEGIMTNPLQKLISVSQRN